jgi:hypothetical protein
MSPSPGQGGARRRIGGKKNLLRRDPLNSAADSSPRTLYRKSIPGSIQARRWDFRPEPMKDPAPYYASAPPWAGRKCLTFAGDATVIEESIKITHSIWRRPEEN